MPRAKNTKIKTTEKKAVKTAKVKGISVAHYDMNGEKKADYTIDEAIFTKKANGQLMSQIVRIYQTNSRQGTQSTKTRSEVTGSTRKIYRQKGTGRARHGDIKAPIFVGGGVAFGPKPRNFRLQLTQKMRRQALTYLLFDKASSQNFCVISGFAGLSGKTKQMAQLFQKIGLTDKKVLLVINKDLDKCLTAARNLENVSIRPVQILSPLDVLSSDYVMFGEEAVAGLSKSQIKPNTTKTATTA